MRSSEIRSSFLRFFEERGHTVVPSSSLVPAEDPTLLFTNAGMNQFKEVFLGIDEREYKTAASSQKCLRAGGKHNDLENVGKTNRHLTFFEMLGNFSFGDYFKEEAILFAWEYLTKEIGLPADTVWISVFEEDDQAMAAWKKITGFPEERIAKLGEKDNFWSMGETGPCGPCSEIGVDLGDSLGCGRAGCAVGCDCDRYLEIWNLVFMQYNREKDGSLTPLPKPSIDTGMGLERIASVLQGATSNFEIDIIMPLIEKMESLCGKSYDQNKTSFRVIADHSRAITFALADGVMPSNEGRGYVIRRILRRAARHGRILGLEEAFLYTLVDGVVEAMGDQYSELAGRRDQVMKIIQAEEERFQETLTLGLTLFEEISEKVAKTGKHVIPGEKAFVLYDTYGFPLDLTMVMAEEKGMSVDVEGFQESLDRQRRKARGARAMQDVSETASLPRTEFVGYQDLTIPSRVKHIEVDGVEVDEAGAGTDLLLVIDPTPFYGEAGGQVGDSGVLRSEELAVSIETAHRKGTDTIVLKGRVKEGILRKGEKVFAEVNVQRRFALERAHTATHLLHAALRETVGTHIQQSGSLVAPDRLRFDFTHYETLNRDILGRVEERVNGWIRESMDVKWIYTGLEEARGMGALAFFGEKYGDVVRVVRVDEISLELCGGTHVSSTGEIGAFHILSEGSVALGVRRIEALTGKAVLEQINSLSQLVEDVAGILKVGEGELMKKVTLLLEENKNLRRELKNAKKEAAYRDFSELESVVPEINGIKVVTRKIDVPDIESLREVADFIRSRIDSGVIVLASESRGKAIFVATVTDDLVERGGMSAGDIVKRVSEIAGGSGGGKPRMAQAGGKYVEKIGEALSAVSGIVEQYLRKE
ncbi:MAG: alanine--tRNA ligase [Candidatus Glassbacteria bacterium]